MSTNPYSFEDEFFEDLGTNGGTAPKLSEDINIGGHIVSTSTMCPICRTVHYVPGLEGLPSEAKAALTKAFEEFVRDRNRKVYPSLVHINFTSHLNSAYGFIFRRQSYIRAALRRADSATNSGATILYDNLVKLFYAEYLIVCLNYKKIFVELIRASNNNKTVTIGADKLTGIYVESAGEFNLCRINHLLSIANEQYTTLAQACNYPVNQTYLDGDVALFKSQDNLENILMLLPIKEQMGKILDDLTNKKD